MVVSFSLLWTACKKKKKKNFIKAQYNNSVNTQHCGRLPEETNVHHAGHLNKKQEAQLMLTTGSTRLAVNQGQQT